MSKRHQASRRKSYGRRQHEVRERQRPRPTSTTRRRSSSTTPARPAPADRFAFVDPRSPAPPLRAERLRMAVYEGARQRARSSSRAARGSERAATDRRAPAAPRRRGRGRPFGPAAARAGSRVVLGGIVVAFMLAFFSLAQSVRVSRATATTSTASRPSRTASQSRRQDLQSDLNRLGRNRPSASWPSTPASARWPNPSSSPLAESSRDHARSHRFPPASSSSCSCFVVAVSSARRPARRTGRSLAARSSRRVAAAADIVRRRGAQPSRRDLRPDRAPSSWPPASPATASSRDAEQLTPEQRRAGRRDTLVPSSASTRQAAANLARGDLASASTSSSPAASTPEQRRPDPRAASGARPGASGSRSSRAGARLPAGRRRPGLDARGAAPRLRQPRGRRPVRRRAVLPGDPCRRARGSWPPSATRTGGRCPMTRHVVEPGEPGEDLRLTIDAGLQLRARAGAPRRPGSRTARRASRPSSWIPTRARSTPRQLPVLRRERLPGDRRARTRAGSSTRSCPASTSRARCSRCMTATAAPRAAAPSRRTTKIKDTGTLRRRRRPDQDRRRRPQGDGLDDVRGRGRLLAQRRRGEGRAEAGQDDQGIGAAISSTRGRTLGFGQPTGIDVAGEVGGSRPRPGHHARGRRSTSRTGRSGRASR